MDVITASLDLASAYHGRYGHGVAAMATDLGKSGTALDQELHERGTAKLGLRTAVKMTELSGNLSILQEFAKAFGQMLVPLPESLDGKGEDCMKRLSETSREFAALCQEVCESLSDGKVTDNELSRINRKSGELILAVHALQTAAVLKNNASKPTTYLRAA